MRATGTVLEAWKPRTVALLEADGVARAYSDFTTIAARVVVAVHIPVILGRHFRKFPI